MPESEAPAVNATLQRLAIVGGYSDHDLYQRNRVLVSLALQMFPDHVVVRPDNDGPPVNPFAPGKQTLWKKLCRVFGDARSLLRQRHAIARCDVVFVPYPAYIDLMLLWATGSLRGKFVVADAFLDLQSTIRDRRLLPDGSWRVRLLLAAERFALSRAHTVLIDTPEQAESLGHRMEGSGARLAVVPVGIDQAQWTPLPAPALDDPIRVLFWGTFIPLHGVETIVEAARVLSLRDRDIQINLIGDGPDADAVAAGLERMPVASLVWRRALVDTRELREAVAHSHIVLGIFGSSPKAAAVIPYKVHQALASNRPVISRASKALGAYADPHAGLFTVDPADADALAEAVLELAQRLRNGWVASTRTIYDDHFSSRIVQESLRNVFENGKSCP